MHSNDALPSGSLRAADFEISSYTGEWGDHSIKGFRSLRAIGLSFRELSLQFHFVASVRIIYCS